MNKMANEIIMRKIKKNLYGKPQSIQVIVPPGFSETALLEMKSILNNLWFKQKYTSEFTLSKNTLCIRQIHLFAITELLMRSRTISDIRLIIFEGSAAGKENFRKKCLGIHWDYFLDKNISLKIKVNSVASRAFHESGLKEILSEILKHDVADIVSGENTNETTSLYVDLYKDRLTISISLAGEPLYKRGYRQMLAASAPLREDAAFCCLDRALQFAKKIDPAYSPDTILIPFAGTGTFAFEYLQSYFNFSPVLFSRDYALKKMPFFKSENFNFLLKKAAEHFSISVDNIHLTCIDNSNNAIRALVENIKNFKKFFEKYQANFPEIKCLEKDFFSLEVEKLIANHNPKFHSIFIPLNPPYGIRIGKNLNSVNFYKKIATKINEIAQLAQNTGIKLSGFILCPDEKTWSSFCKHIKKMSLETYHFNQGGMDIRVCQFLLNLTEENN